MNKLLLIVAVVFAGYVGLTQYGGRLPNDQAGISKSNEATSSTGSDSVLASAFENKTSNLQIEGKGTVLKMLKDDTDGSRHQRFIIRLDSGQTLLVAHNIDLAPRINALREGDALMFNGEYEWSAKGGVIHWTHHDPSGRHAAGWLKHNGEIYQ
ncbi:MAG: DUF3465 domain-containing protein [Sulfurimicrobium sp.]|nr:DUF3465 domain-containing protein [Sulfurimicrobium sp.]